MGNSLIGNLPHIFFATVTEEINPKLKDFYEEKQEEARVNRKAYGYYWAGAFYDAAVSAFKTDLNGKEDQSAIRKYAAVRKRNNARKKKTWYESLVQKREQYPKDSPQFPFRNLVLKKSVLKTGEWVKVYGQKTLDGIIKEQMDEAERWSKDEDSFFIDFPAFDSLTPGKAYKAFESDCVSEFLRIIRMKWDYDLESFTKTYVDSMTGAYFTSSSKKIQAPEGDGDYTAEIPTDVEGASKLLVTIGREAFGANNTAITMLDTKDQAILFEIVSRASKELVADKPILIETGELAKKISKSSKPSARVYDDAEQRCYKLVNITYNKFDASGKRVGAINYLSSALPMQFEGKRYMSISLGSTMYDAIISNKVRRIRSDDYDKIEQKIGKIMILSLQKERIKAFSRYKNGAKSCSASFTCSDIMGMANFGTANRRKIMQMARAAFLEFADKKIMVEDVRYDGVSDTINVKFFPLTEDEERDLTWYGYEEDDVVEVQ